MTVVTRFAPSPTGFLHIGGARTALFNWLFARHHGGAFRLRIEDTDRKRSTEAAKAAILEGLGWLGFAWDGEVVYQSMRAARHAEVAQTLLDHDCAYRCYCTPEELAEMRELAKTEGRPVPYDGRWRDRDPGDAPPGVAPVIRIKMPRGGETVIEDAVQGEVRVPNEQLDDTVLLRADGTPTYMLSVVVDDHDMGVTHVIRGDDHLTNAFRQYHILRALDIPAPVYAHIPLIHGPDGAKLSKRHGALGVDAYRDMGYLPEAIRNHLLRLGWSHGNDEVISTGEAIAWFGLDHVGRSPARFDFARLDSLNRHYIQETADARLVEAIAPGIAEQLGHESGNAILGRLERGMPSLKNRVNTLVELTEKALFYALDRPLDMDQKADRILDGAARALLGRLASRLGGIEDWTEAGVEAETRAFAEAEVVNLGQVAQPLRAALTGRGVSPGIFEVMAALGREETLGRISDVKPGVA
jgi:glutamyl-tRNA synthetase